MEVRKKNKLTTERETDVKENLHVTYFTDPLCCWSWGMQPHVDGIQDIYGGDMSVKYVMGGMLSSWERFHDEVNAVSRPVQMGPVWMHAAQLTGRPIDHLLWVKDPPASSYPACIGVKCADLQSPIFGVAYFKRLQEAAMANRKNIASYQVLETVAYDMAQEHKNFDVQQFITDYQGENGASAFRTDLEITARYGITRFPALLVEHAGRKPIIISGYNTLTAIVSAITQAFGIEADADSA